MNITDSNSDITTQDIDNYLAGNLSHKEMHFIESQSLEDPFLADVLEGYKLFPNEVSNVPALKQKNSWIWILSTLSLLLFIGVVLYISLPAKAESLSSKKLAYTKNTTSEKIVLKTPFKENVPVKEKIIPTEPNIHQKKTSIKEKMMPLVREIVNLETYELKPEIYSQETNYDLARVKVKTIAYYNFIAVDYSVIYIDNHEFEEINLGTPASQANATSSYSLTDEMMLSSKTKKYTYKEYLKKSLKHLSNQSYNYAVSNFKIIQEHYPQDVNAQFYSGFSLFNLGKFNKAISFFDKAMNNSFDFFYEDVQWYKALCLESTGKMKEAKTLFKKIYKEYGFYANQAYQKI